MKECPRCLFTDDIAIIPESGQCNYCDLQDAQKAAANFKDWPGVLQKIKDKGRGKQYDCLIGISGGEDSSVLLYLAVVSWGLRPLVIHFDNRTNRPQANNNIEQLTRKLVVNFIRYYVDQGEYEQLTDSFLAAGLQDADIPNDIAMAKLMYVAARENGIKYILNGHDVRNEGNAPAKWTIMDARYIQSVFKAHTGQELKNYPLYTIWDQIMASLHGIKQVRPYHYHHFDRPVILDRLKEMGWQDYGGKHNENVYTAFVGNYLLPIKFGIDKRRVYFSAQIREGEMTKEEARVRLSIPAKFDLNDLGERKSTVLSLMSSPTGSRDSFKRYNFKRWKVLIWLLTKLKVVPMSMHKKYCQ